MFPIIESYSALGCKKTESVMPDSADEMFALFFCVYFSGCLHMLK